MGASPHVCGQCHLYPRRQCGVARALCSIVVCGLRRSGATVSRRSSRNEASCSDVRVWKGVFAITCRSINRIPKCSVLAPLCRRLPQHSGSGDHLTQPSDRQGGKSPSSMARAVSLTQASALFQARKVRAGKALVTTRSKSGTRETQRALRPRGSRLSDRTFLDDTTL